MFSNQVESILYSVQKLRPMPTHVTRILKELENPRISASTISDFVSLDQALAALVLQQSNSAALGYGRTCTTINEAVARIGLNRLRTVLMASSATGPLMKRMAGYRLGAGELWHHSLATAHSAEWLSRTLKVGDPEEAYASGLLHDIGKLVLDQYVLTDYTRIVDYVEQYRIPLWKVEEKLLGIDHARVGGMIADRWSFPTSLADAIRFHHAPNFSSSGARLPALVNLANALAVELHSTQAGLFSGEIHADTFIVLNLSPNDLPRLKTGIHQSLEMRGI
jgi:putative nucleotidyltransferase with HDIG domain